MNAVERFLAASQARDLDAAVAELAPEVVMMNPATDEPVLGKAAVAAALRAVQLACDEFRHTHLLAGASAGSPPLYGLVFEAKIGPASLRGVDLIDLDEHDRIARFEVAARPIGALIALGTRMGGSSPA